MSFESVVRGFHVYNAIWTPVLNTEHSTQQEHGNTEDQYAVSIINNDVVVGHVLKELSQTFWLFIERGGEISCKLTGRRLRSPLLQGGMEIPCICALRGKKIGGQAQVFVEDYGWYFYINQCVHTRMLVLAMWIINVHNSEEIGSKLFTIDIINFR